LNRNAEPEDTAQARLKLLSRTLREDPTRLGRHVRYFKTPYMLRESSRSDLARTIAVLPNLVYVDLPEGMFSDEPSFQTLRLEVEARCADLRKMTYMGGSEGSLTKLARGMTWRNLEVLELVRINMAPATLRHVLGALQNLRALKVTETNAMSDEIFWEHEAMPPFPPLSELVLTKTPRVTAAGLNEYLKWPAARKSLKVLTLNGTGIKPANLQQAIAGATSLRTLAIHENVIQPLSNTAQVELLSSKSLRTLRFEIGTDPSSSPYSGAAASYYQYLATSLLSRCLPNLRAVYVQDRTFPDQLLGLTPPSAPFAFGGRPSSSSSNKKSPTGYLSPPNSGGSHRLSSNNPFAHHSSLTRTLEVFTKGEDEMDWSFMKVNPHGQNGGDTSRYSMVSVASQQGLRPGSSYGLGSDVAGSGWASGGARRSVMIGNGAGGFLAVPNYDSGIAGVGGNSGRGEELWPRPVSSAGEKRRGDRDLWR
jgi:hypothetical protein